MQERHVGKDFYLLNWKGFLCSVGGVALYYELMNTSIKTRECDNLEAMMKVFTYSTTLHLKLSVYHVSMHETACVCIYAG